MLYLFVWIYLYNAVFIFAKGYLVFGTLLIAVTK